MNEFDCQRRRFLRSASVASVGLPVVSESVAATAGSGREHSATEMVSSTDERLVGAHYYPWWGRPGHWSNGYFGQPTLGEYSSRDPDVIRQHVDWAKQAGVNWFSMSWWGRDSWSDRTVANHFADHPASKELQWSILYETPGQFSFDGNDVNLSDPENREQLRSDLGYFSDNFFDHDTYLRIDGKPVVYFYIAHAFEGDIEGAFDAAQEAIGEDVYLLFSLFITNEPSEKFERLMRYADGVTAYSQYQDREGINEDFARKATDEYDDWLLTAKSLDCNFIPPTLPGKHDGVEEDADQVVLKRSPRRFRRVCERARRYVDPDLNAILVTSFNEWHEGTQIEPGESYGTTYLDATREALGNADFGGFYERVTPMVLDFSETVPEHELNSDASKADSRDLAFRCSELELYDASGRTVERFDVGVPSDEPVFGQGAFHPVQNDVRSARWFGGPLARTTMYFQRELLDQTYSMRIRGVAAGDDLTATVRLDGEPVAELDLVRQGWQDFDVQLRELPTTTESRTETSAETTESTTRQPTRTEQRSSTTDSTTSTDGMGVLTTAAGIVAGAALWARGRDEG